MLRITALVLCMVCCVHGWEDSFSEELVLDHLPSGHVYSLFQFSTNWSVNVFENRMPTHYHLFPKSLGEIVDKFQVAELHLSLTQGRWLYDKWGYPPVHAPVGVQIWVWFHPHLSEQQVSDNWKGLVHALSGQFCSSLNFVTEAYTLRPTIAFKPQGVWLGPANASVHLRHAMLPREGVCTENLTPWKKLLPCIAQAGLSTLLNAEHLYDSSYHSLAVHLRSTCQNAECEDSKLELKQSVTSVFDPQHASLQSGFSLKKLFGRKLSSTCPLANRSALMVRLNQHFDAPTLTPKAEESVARFSKYDLKKQDFSEGFDIQAQYGKQILKPSQPSLVVHKSATGYGGERGGSLCTIRNNAQQALNISYLDTIPYFVRVYFHTVTVKLNNQQINMDQRLRFTPGFLRERPASMEFWLTVPPQSSVSVEYEFEKVFLDWLNHPPDSHHGYYISPSVISTRFEETDSNISQLCSFLSNPCNLDGGFHRVYTDAILVLLPLPDFSMPYNVICLTSTVIAIAFGTVYNATTRTFQIVSDEEEKRQGPVAKVKTLLAKFFGGGSKEKES